MSPQLRPRRTLTTLACSAALALTAPLAPVAPAAAEEPVTLATARTAGQSRVTPAMQAEIDRVVAEGRAIPRLTARASARTLASATARCAELEGLRYCLGVGWTTRSEEQVARGLAAAARQVAGRETTGDLGPQALLEQTAHLSPRVRARRERVELTDAARSVAKVWLLRHEIQGVPLPDDFAARHPEAVVSGGDRQVAARSTSTTSQRKTAADYPRRSTILKIRQSRSQNRTYWCGPAAMQAIGWGWHDERRIQKSWARRLRTTSNGTAITEMVRVTNNRTGWDRESRAGRYIVLDIGDWKFRQWYLLMMRHIKDYRAPVILHPVLLKRYFPYLDDDASGHFQVGRGYDKNPSASKQIGYVEVWDQSKFDPSEPRIPRRQWRSAYKSFRANKAHFQHNVGV
jgi:hypothetical protein